jgi:hypothetical protein
VIISGNLARYNALMSAQDIAPYAQIGTAIVAIAAVVVATWSLLAQKAVARRRAAIDFFVKVEMDEKMLKAYDLYVESKAKMPSSSSMKSFTGRRIAITFLIT